MKREKGRRNTLDPPCQMECSAGCSESQDPQVPKSLEVLGASPVPNARGPPLCSVPGCAVPCPCHPPTGIMLNYLPYYQRFSGEPMNRQP